jgi:hypothetical protein
MSLEYSTADSIKDLQQILSLQQQNLERYISSEELRQEGFVTVHHDFELLEEMNKPHPHIIAKSDEVVVGYTLVMLRQMAQRIPILIPMFDKINRLQYKDQALKDATYFIMGQVCISKSFRGKGVFANLYQKLKEEMRPHFQFCITEVAVRNPRSMRAHEKIGFKRLYQYSGGHEEWVILIWEL